MKWLATGAAVVALAPFAREALTHPSFVKLRYRFLAIAAILCDLALILNGIWNLT